MNLNREQQRILKNILNATLRDCMYTTLLGLDGSASIGNVQQLYSVRDEDGNELTGGDIETYAWEYFHNRPDEHL